MILTANCVFTTWVLFVKGSGLKKTLVDLMDSSISFTLSAGIPLVLVVTPLLVYLTQGYSAHNFTWRAEMLTSTRFFIASTPWQLAMNVAPSVANYITLQGILKRLNKRWRRASVKTMISVVVTHGSFRVLQQRNVRSTVKAMVVLGKDSFTTQHANSKWLKGMLVLCIVWGVAVATVAIASQLTRRPCPTGCVAQSAPWFTQSCNCIYFRLNCNSPRDLPVQNPLDGVHVTELGANLMLLHLIRCPVEEGVPNLAPFEFLQGILVEFSSMRSWEGVLPPSLSTVQVRYSDLTHVPAALRSPGPNLIELGLVGAPLGDISPTVVDSWGSVMSLALTATNLSSIPPGLLRLQVLETVALDSNRIVVVPDDEVAAVPQLVSLVLDSNRISTFPTKLMTANPQLHLSLSNNPIRAVPSDLTSQSTMSMDLAGSPYCLENPRDSSHCPSTCDTACTRSQSSNQVCDLPCNTSSCLYDMGDCLL
ncbi:hypothetical protein DYB32_003420 [Aphanomyces invadans]|uniref:LNR domain-containing protein n=1 Tax=Aphanomyces invadans TaxID=157072 RepID=A0A3R6ZSK2_9STRA|nr:hypothetical protein DYB32_003420 [Aphanomyces invadans]